jgi:predicted nucleic acid-binding protein
MITIDSQIWIYFFDGNAEEHQNVAKWMKEWIDSHDSHEKILLSAIIPVEVCHNISKHIKLPPERIETMLTEWLNWDLLEIAEVDYLLVGKVIQRLQRVKPLGIGGRDCLIIETMDLYNVSTLITHDTGLLKMQEYRRIDPSFDPPLFLEQGTMFDIKTFRSRIPT